MTDITQQHLDIVKGWYPVDNDIQKLTLDELLKNAAENPVDWRTKNWAECSNNASETRPNQVFVPNCSQAVGIVVLDVIGLALGIRNASRLFNTTALDELVQNLPHPNVFTQAITIIGNPNTTILEKATAIFNVLSLVGDGAAFAAVIRVFIQNLTWWEKVLYGTRAAATITVIVSSAGIAFIAQVVSLLAAGALTINDSYNAALTCNWISQSTPPPSPYVSRLDVAGVAIPTQVDPTDFPGWGEPLSGPSRLTFIIASPDSQGYIGIGTDQFVYTNPSLDGTNWTRQDNSASILSIAAKSGGAYYATGTANNIYWNFKLGQTPWTPTNSKSLFKCMAFYIDGSIIGVGTGDGYLYQLASIDEGTASELIGNSATITNVTVLNDGTVAAVSTDGFLLLRKTLTSDWVRIENSGTITAVAEMQDKINLMAIGTDNKIYRTYFTPN